MSEERDCTKCKHKKKVRIRAMGFYEEACELWDCKFEPREEEILRYNDLNHGRKHEGQST